MKNRENIVIETPMRHKIKYFFCITVCFVLQVPLFHVVFQVEICHNQISSECDAKNKETHIYVKIYFMDGFCMLPQPHNAFLQLPDQFHENKSFPWC